MSPFDWCLVLGINGAIIAYGLLRSRETKTSSDWFLAGRTLPWWIVGLSLWATAIDASDIVADSGGTYSIGIRYFVTNWVGTVTGWVVAANFIALPMYRAGMYTNAEYLEARFGPATRIISALVQVQYRTLVLGIISTTIYLTLSVVCGWNPVPTWCAVVGIAALATAYTATGGLKSVAVTDALQSIVMVVASVILFGIVWNHVAGWSGMRQSLDAQQSGLSEELLHVGRDNVEAEDVNGWTAEQIDRRLLIGGQYDPEAGQIVRRTPAWLTIIGYFILGMAYSIVNHTQSMRMFGARSEWDLRMSAVLAGAILIVTTFTNLMMGIMGRAAIATFPDDVVQLQTNDVIYPLLVRELAGPGMIGLVMAGILAASFSTFDSIGSTLSSLLVRDVYARLLVKDQGDNHYLRVGQWLTPVVIFGSFAYVPFLLAKGMLIYFIDLVGAFVAPLLTIYLMGIFTRAHRKSGAIGLGVGVTYGVLRLLAPLIADQFDIQVLPAVMIGGPAGWLFGVLVTMAAMTLVTLFTGREPSGKLLHEEKSGWLRSSQLQVRALDESHRQDRSNIWPILLSIAVVLTGAFLSFVVFW